MEDRVEREIAITHGFLTEWFAGRVPRTEAHVAAHFVGRLDPGFELVYPTGEIIDVDRLGREIWAGYGSAPDFEISADNFRCRLGDGDTVIATFHEWQRNAVRSKPANNGRIATVVFRIDDAADNGLRWVQVHETWLPPRMVEKRFAPREMNGSVRASRRSDRNR